MKAKNRVPITVLYELKSSKELGWNHRHKNIDGFKFEDHEIQTLSKAWWICLFDALVLGVDTGSGKTTLRHTGVFSIDIIVHLTLNWSWCGDHFMSCYCLYSYNIPAIDLERFLACYQFYLKVNFTYWTCICFISYIVINRRIGNIEMFQYYTRHHCYSPIFIRDPSLKVLDLSIQSEK